MSDNSKTKSTLNKLTQQQLIDEVIKIGLEIESIRFDYDKFGASVELKKIPNLKRKAKRRIALIKNSIHQSQVESYEYALQFI